MWSRTRFTVPAGLLISLAAFTTAQPGTTETAPDSPVGLVPPDTTAYIAVDVKALWDHKSCEEIKNARGQVEFAWAVQSLIGVTPGDVDQLVVFWHPAGGGSPFVVVTARQPLDAQVVARTLTRLGATKSVSKVKVLSAPGAEFPHVIAVGPRTLLLAPSRADPAGLEELAAQVKSTGPTGSATLVSDWNVRAVEKAGFPVRGLLVGAERARLTAKLGKKDEATIRLQLAYDSREKAQSAAGPLRAKLDELAGWASAREKQVLDRGPVGTGYPAPLLEWVAKTLRATKLQTNDNTVLATADMKLDELASALVNALPDAVLAPRGRSAAENNLKQIILAFHSYCDANSRTPSNSYDKDGKPLLSWRVHLLPYLEQNAVYHQFKLDEPWDSPHNKPLGQLVLKVFQVPGRPAGQPWETYFRAFIGPKGVKPEHRPWLVEGESNGPPFPAAFPDGTSNTWLVVEAAEAVPWSKPDDLPYDGVLPLPKLGGPAGTYVAGFADGSTRTFRRGQIDATNMRYLISIADGNVVNIPDR